MFDRKMLNYLAKVGQVQLLLTIFNPRWEGCSDSRDAAGRIYPWWFNEYLDKLVLQPCWFQISHTSYKVLQGSENNVIEIRYRVLEYWLQRCWFCCGRVENRLRVVASLLSICPCRVWQKSKALCLLDSQARIREGPRITGTFHRWRLECIREKFKGMPIFVNLSSCMIMLLDR